jgi:hypothetical protein
MGKPGTSNCVDVPAGIAPPLPQDVHLIVGGEDAAGGHQAVRLRRLRVVPVLGAAHWRFSFPLGDDWSAGVAQVVVDPFPHGLVHRVPGQVWRMNPTDLAGFRARGRLPGDGPGGQDDAEFAAYLVVAGVVDHVTGVGVEAGQPVDLAVDTGFLEGLADGGLADGLVQLDGAAWQCPVLVIGPAGSGAAGSSW